MDTKKNPSISKKSALAIAAVLVLGLLLGAAILGIPKAGPAGHAEHADTDDHGHANGAQEEPNPGSPRKGPHGGWLFSDGGFALELSIFEKGVEPEFRAYASRDGKPLPPARTQLTVTLERLGRAPEVFRFTAAQDHLKGSAVVEEPHSFVGTVEATTADGKRHTFRFEQVEGRVQIGDEQLQRQGVEVATAGPARIRGDLALLGEVRLDQDRSVFVTPRLAGVVEAVHANAGDRVRRGQLLAVISSQALADLRSEWLAAQKRLALARTTHEREKQLWEEKISAEQDFLAARHAFQEAGIAAESARQKLLSLGAGGTAVVSTQGLTRLEVRSPIDGVVTEKKVGVGEVLKEDVSIFQVADLSSVWVELDVPAREVHRLKVGAEAVVKSSAFDTPARGRLTHVGALVGEQSRTATARLVLPNPQGLWRPGLAVSVSLAVEEVEVPVAVSAEALQSLNGRTVVFGRYGTAFEARPVVTGRSDGRVVEVLKGLQAGERHAARNSFLVKADIGKAGAGHDH